MLTTSRGPPMHSARQRASKGVCVPIHCPGGSTLRRPRRSRPLHPAPPPHLRGRQSRATEPKHGPCTGCARHDDVAGTHVDVAPAWKDGAGVRSRVRRRAGAFAPGQRGSSSYEKKHASSRAALQIQVAPRRQAWRRAIRQAYRRCVVDRGSYRCLACATLRRCCRCRCRCLEKACRQALGDVNVPSPHRETCEWRRRERVPALCRSGAPPRGALLRGPHRRIRAVSMSVHLVWAWPKT